MKPQHFAALVSVLALMALILLVPGRPVPGSGQGESEPPRVVTVLGEGEVRARPDQVILTFGVSTWTQGASAAEAEALHVASVDRLQAALQGAGADATQIEVRRPVVLPLTRQDYAGKTYLTGYHAATTVVVTLSNLQRVDAVVAAGLANGATQLVEAEYGLRDPSEVRGRALQAAVANARDRASAMVQSQNRSLGDLVGVEMVAEEAPTKESIASPTTLVYRVQVRGTFEY